MNHTTTDTTRATEEDQMGRTAASSTRTSRRLAAVAIAAVLVVGACEADESDIDPAAAEPTATSTPAAIADAAPPAEEPADVEPVSIAAPEVHAVASARRAMKASDHEVEVLSAVVTTGEHPDPETITEWIIGLTRLERALDADAIRALGEDPLLEEIAGPIEELDESINEVLALLDPADGEPDLVGALVEATAAVSRWQEAAPGVEAAWEELAAQWISQWEDAVVEWEAAWGEAVAEWEAAWAEAVAEWEAAWAEAVAEWEAAWQAAVEERQGS